MGIYNGGGKDELVQTTADGNKAPRDQSARASTKHNSVQSIVSLRKKREREKSSIA
jgi:hypothetical protein